MSISATCSTISPPIPQTRAILLYVEGITHGRKFMSAARAASRIKPVLVLKAGRSNAGARAATSHTGVLAGADAVYDAAFRRAGMLRVATMAELFDAAETLALTREQVGERLAILTNGGGAGVLATDALVAAGGQLAALSEETIAELNRLLPATWSHGNPVDIIGDASGKRYADALAALIRDPEVDAILVLNCPTALAQPEDAARCGNRCGRRGRTGGAARPQRDHRLARRAFREGGAAALCRGPHRHLRNPRQRGRRFPAPGPPSAQSRAADGNTAGAAGCASSPISRRRGASSQRARGWESPGSIRKRPAPSLRPMASRSSPITLPQDPDEAAAVAASIGFPVALKIRSPDITHKSDVGGVALNLGDADRVRREASAMLERVKAARPDARLDGFLLQPMVSRPGAVELLVGLVEDPVFGPVVAFGQGGTAVEIVHDTSLELPPLNALLARRADGAHTGMATPARLSRQSHLRTSRRSSRC